jgi:hypothetical protein
MIGLVEFVSPLAGSAPHTIVVPIVAADRAMKSLRVIFFFMGPPHRYLYFIKTIGGRDLHVNLQPNPAAQSAGEKMGVSLPAWREI